MHRKETMTVRRMKTPMSQAVDLARRDQKDEMKDLETTEERDPTKGTITDVKGMIDVMRDEKDVRIEIEDLMRIEGSHLSDEETIIIVEDTVIVASEEEIDGKEVVMDNDIMTNTIEEKEKKVVETTTTEEDIEAERIAMVNEEVMANNSLGQTLEATIPLRRTINLKMKIEISIFTPLYQMRSEYLDKQISKFNR